MAGLLTASDLAARWGCSPSTVNRMARNRVLPALKRGRDWRFSPEAVAAYETRHTTSVAAEQTPDGGGYRAAPTPMRPAANLDGEYALIVPGPVPWRAEIVEAAPAAGRARSADKQKAGSGRN